MLDMGFGSVRTVPPPVARVAGLYRQDQANANMLPISMVLDVQIANRDEILPFERVWRRSVRDVDRSMDLGTIEVRPSNRRRAAGHYVQS